MYIFLGLRISIDYSIVILIFLFIKITPVQAVAAYLLYCMQGNIRPRYIFASFALVVSERI